MDLPHTRSQLESNAAHIGDRFGVAALALTGDVTDETSVSDAYATIERDMGTIDVVFSNAGIMIEDTPDIDLADWNRVLQVNLTGMLLVSRTAANMMKAHGHGGSIILMSSMSGRIVNRMPPGGRYGVSYYASKAGVSHLAKVLAMDYAPFGIRVNSISPGYILSGVPDAWPKEQLDWLASTVPMQRLGTLDEIVGPVVFLASDLAAYATGTDILVDGGYCVW
jgi:NAD(P)-dependent dehydrogenase (short-subunit alcohol dehydrogenase family)